MSVPRAVVEELSVLAGRVTALEAQVAELRVWVNFARKRVPFSPEQYAAMFGELSCDDEADD